ncbi:apolipoprotein N-acyltransferase [Brachybacterium sp. EF45031]|uniref:apolipoprotein N-acyltransferase n=1 Tax=Brachybacterium sillae TaxID=2810536 RepID=UPI00217F02B3|nr:apolipoprotein N-acyltransferase [Brachybacterium sillae]MCS6710660.1 apolipoprotein N-acyltransferase [Brachybacterium sillae]
MTSRVTGRDARSRHREQRPAPTPGGRFATTPAGPALLAALAAGLCLLLAFPPYGLWALFPVGLALLTLAVHTRTAPVALAAGVVAGLAFFLPLTEWANMYAGATPWVALAVFEALYLVVYAALAHLVLRRRGPGLVSALMLALLWGAVEVLRSTVPWGGLSWGIAAFSQSASPLLNLGPWTGVFGLGVVVALLGQLLGLGLFALLGRVRGGDRLRGLWPVSAVIAVVLACLLVPHPSLERTGSLRIAGVQGNVDPIEPQQLVMPETTFSHHLDVTDQVIAEARDAREPLDLIVWPEDSVGWDPRQDTARGDALAQRARDAGAPLIVGTQSLDAQERRWNLALQYDADGRVVDSYAKRHPVPFGEYIPARDVFRRLSDKVELVPVDMSAGSEPGLMQVRGRTIGVLICFEIAYEELVQDLVDGGAEVIVVQSNNALFGDSYESIQQLAQARVMAVVSGRSIVHVSTVGESAIYTPDGRQLAFVDHWEAGAVAADVPLMSGHTPAMLADRLIPLGIVVGAMAALAATLLRRPVPRSGAGSTRGASAAADGRGGIGPRRTTGRGTRG